jgi:hypothetical protein
MTHALADGTLPLAHPVDIDVAPALAGRNRLTCGFRFILAIPHMILVGGPMAFAMTWFGGSDGEPRLEWGSAGVFGALAAIIGLIAWFAIVFTGRFPRGLWSLSAMYLRWRVRAVAYLMLLRDEYPPFGDAPYSANAILPEPTAPRDRVTVAFRIFLIMPHLLVLWVLGVAWAVSTLIAWFAILFTGDYPRTLYEFSVGVLRWTTRVEAYFLLLRDEYPPFSLE